MARAPFRSVPVGSPETELSGIKKPPGFAGVGDRSGGAMVFDWYVVFIDDNGDPMLGGSATLQWYGVEFIDAGVVTPTLGDAVAVDALTVLSKSVGARLWPWCRITAITPPNTSKIVEVTIPSAEDGTWAIEIDGDDIYSFKASGSSIGLILDGLFTQLIANGASITVSAPAVGTLRFVADVDFALILTSPGDVMTQEDIAALATPAAEMRVYMAESGAVVLAEDSITRFSVAAAAAVVDALPPPEESTSDLAAAVVEAIVVPDTTDILAQVQAGIVAECANFGALRTLVNLPDPARTGELTGSTSYEIRAIVSDKYTTLYGFTISSDIACTVTWWSGNTFNMSDTTPIQAGGNWTVAPTRNRPFKTNLEEAMKLVCSSSSAKLRITYWAEYINSFNDSP
jgi:hypothetical protein